MNLRKRPMVLIVRDGWGHNPHREWDHANAVVQARTPVNDRLVGEFPHVLIRTSGEDVGLPGGVMGNSEVGHQNIGAGRIVDQEVMRISRRIRDGSFFSNEVLAGAVERARQNSGHVHLLGLCSDAGVHSILEHLYALLELCRRMDLPGDRVLVHAFSDGRDTPPNSGIEFIRRIEAKMQRIGVGRVASVIGRYWAMDRDNRWDRVEKAYRLLTESRGRSAPDAESAFQHYYDNPSEASMCGDEFIEPISIVDGDGQPLPRIANGDSVIFFNFRGDRPREITKAFTYDTFPFSAVDKDGTEREMGFARGKKLDLFYATMTGYESGLPVHVAFDKPEALENILGAHLSQLGLCQFRCAETEKYAHVTFFFNDYRQDPFPNEDRSLVPSPREVSTYDQKPEMSASEITDEMIRRIASGRYDFMVLNYANGDMVGHTGNMNAAVRAVEAVDQGVGRVIDATHRAGGCAIVTADHGNCEQMIDPETGGPHTAHTTYDVFLIVVDEDLKGRSLRSGGRLADIAPTALYLMGLAAPPQMTGRSLIPDE